MTTAPTLLAVFAHPDDESLVAGGTLARYAAAGVRVALLCATRGEWGPISDEALADYETLGSVREQELRAACEILGVQWLQFLDLPDGSVSWAMEQEEYGALEKIVRALRELRPQVVLTFGPDGWYGHQDHIAIGQLTAIACELAAKPQSFPAQNLAPHRCDKLYYSAWPADLLPALLNRLHAANLPANLWNLPPEQFGIPATAITTTIDVRDFVQHKFAALRRHRTQMTADHAFTALSHELTLEFFGQESFRLVSAKNAQLPESDLFTGLCRSKV